MAPSGCLRISRTLPNLPLVEEDAESVDSSGGDAPRQSPPPPPPSPDPLYRELEEMGIHVPHGNSQSSISSGTTLVTTTTSRSASPHGRHNSDTSEHQNRQPRDHFVARMNTSLDPTSASFEPAGARIQQQQPPNRFGVAARQKNSNQNVNNSAPMDIAQIGDGNGVIMQQYQQEQQHDGNVYFLPQQSQAAALQTFPVQYPTAHPSQQNIGMVPTFSPDRVHYTNAQATVQPSSSGYYQNSLIINPQGLTNQQPQQSAVQTPQSCDEGSVDRFTPGTYRFTPDESIASPMTNRSSASSVSGYPPSTEPRSFAPRTSGLGPRGPPPQFDLQIAALVQQNAAVAPSAPQNHAPDQSQVIVVKNRQAVNRPNYGAMLPRSPRGEMQHTFPKRSANPTRAVPSDNGGHGSEMQHTFPNNQVAVVSSGNTDDRGFDPFRTFELPAVIKPIETFLNVLITHNHPVPEHIRKQRSKQLNELTAGPNALPTIEMALHPAYFPFVEGPRQTGPSRNWGVVKIKNIPFAVRHADVLAFLGRNSRVLNDRQEPVHIIMERVTSKTNDCYVEFMTMQDAVHAVERHNRVMSSGRQNRLGDRPVEMELSSQAALMQDLFPHARGVRWEGSRPVILEDHPSEPWECFKGFITEEEMVCLVKHVEVPQRSPFSRECPQRPYECMISTLRKFPWYMTEYITNRQRWAVHKAVLALVTRLKNDLRVGKLEEHLTEQLFKRLVTSAMSCDGFTVTMKDDVAYIAELSDAEMLSFHQPRFANMWSHQYTMIPKPGTPLDVVEWFIAIIREETERTLCQTLPHIQAAIREDAKGMVLYWGWLYKELNYPPEPIFPKLTLAEMASREFTVVTDILRRAFKQH